MPCRAWLLLSLCAAVAADRALRISELVRAAPYGQSDPLSVNGILWLEHINMIVGKRALAEAFYVDFLGLTLDPASGDRSRDSFHLNIGRQQASATRKCHTQVPRASLAFDISAANSAMPPFLFFPSATRFFWSEMATDVTLPVFVYITDFFLFYHRHSYSSYYLSGILFQFKLHLSRHVATN